MLLLLLLLPLISIPIILLINLINKKRIEKTLQYEKVSFQNNSLFLLSKKEFEKLDSILYNGNISKYIGLTFSILTFWLSLIIWYRFDASNPNLQFVETIYSSPFKSSYYSEENVNIITLNNDERLSKGGFNEQIKLGIDGLSLYFVLLTCLIFPITILSDLNITKYVKTSFNRLNQTTKGINNINNSLSYNNLNGSKTSESLSMHKKLSLNILDKYNDFLRNKDMTMYIIIMMLLESILNLVFLVQDLLLFYISFEATLPPLFILIGYFGSSNKIKASYYLLLYTLFGSLFLLIAILTIYYLCDTLDYMYIISSPLSFEIQCWLWLLMFISFAVKTPLFPFHIWLNLAHSEAPLGGSILLASIILKLALYGFLRIVIPMLPLACIYYSPLIYLISTITIIWASLATLRQVDSKRIVAYSSVGHVAVSLLGAFSNSIVGIEGSIILGLAHGLVSPSLFIIVGGVLYSRYHTRMINYYRGLITYYPLISLYFFLFSLSNAAVPLSLNFIGEFMSLNGAFYLNPIVTTFAASSIILSAAYSIWLWSRISTGAFSKYLKVYYDLSRREFYILTPLLCLTIVLGIYPQFILNDLHMCISNIII